MPTVQPILQPPDYRSTRTSMAAMLTATAVWMTIPILVKIALRSFDPILISTTRLSMAVIVLVALHRARGGRIRDLTTISAWHLVGGIALGVNYLLFSVGMSLTTASAGAVVIQVQIVTLVLLARWVLQERLSIVKLIAITCVMAAGALVLAAPATVNGLMSRTYLSGNLVMLVAGIGFGIYGLASRALAGSPSLRRRTTLQVAIPILFIASVINLLLLPFARWPNSISAETTVALLFLSVIGTALNYTLMTVAFRRLSAAIAGTMTALTPPGVLVLAAVALDEPVPVSILAAAAIVTASLIALVIDERRSHKQ